MAIGLIYDIHETEKQNLTVLRICMANKRHFAILKKGAQIWNEWRKTNKKIIPDLSGADLQGMDLRSVRLRGANLQFANMSRTDFRPLDSHGEGKWLDEEEIKPGEYWPDSIAISLGHTDFRGANLAFAKLNSTVLVGAILTDTILTGARLENTDFAGVTFGNTVFNNVDLSNASLVNLQFRQPCSIDRVTLQKLNVLAQPSNRQNEVELFLQGCGLNDWEIEVAKLHSANLRNDQISDILYRVHDLLSRQPIQINPLFISYNHQDNSFVDLLEYHLNQKGIRFWRDMHHATAGRLERQIDRAIRLNPTVLLILSRHSVDSDWVQHEAHAARKLEIESGRDVLCPIALDSCWKNCRWPKRLLEQITEYNILDFCNWQDDRSFREMFTKLVDGLGLYYTKEKALIPTTE